MKLLFIYGAFIWLLTSSLSAQIGINTTNPQETLHVAGTVRIDNTNQATVTATKIFGLDAVGTLREISIGPRLKLSNNVIIATNDHYFGSISLTTKTNHNVDLLLDNGETNEGKTIIKINNTAGDTEFTGIKDGYDGQHIWIYAQSGKVTLKKNDTNSSAGNRIEDNDRLAAEQWAMIELVYDGARSKWIVMHHNH
ncbi:hypothetical protein [Algibacter sp.]|uniref:hypothetical protein n=1 Tax=Algibacter sp. TaxID=1872428 RepID=UPI003C76EAA4